MKDKKNMYILMLLAVIFAIGIGYAVLAQQLTINGVANISANWDVKITNISNSSLNGATIKNPATYDDTSATFDVELGYPGASATFEVTVLNNGTIDAVLDSISGVEQANSQTPTYITYDVTGAAANDTLNSSEQKVVTVTVTWDANETSVPDETVSKTATINLNYVQAT